MTVRPATSLDEVAPLWVTLAAHHYEVGAALSAVAAPIGAAASWDARRSQYASWSSEPGWLLSVAKVDGTVSGYAAARITPSASAWDLGDRVGRLERLRPPGSRRARGGRAGRVR